MVTPNNKGEPRDNDTSPGWSSGDGSGGNVGGEVTLRKGAWTTLEDAILKEYIEKNGERNWMDIQKSSGLARCAKSCRLRWANHLRPDLKKDSFTPEEEKIICEEHAKYGNKWSRISAQLPGRTDNKIKNYWNTRMKRRLKQRPPLYTEGIEGGQYPTFDDDNHHQHYNNINNSHYHHYDNINGNDSPNHRSTPSASTNQTPLSPSTPTSQFEFYSPHQHRLSSLPHLSSPHSLSSSPLSIAPQQSPTVQSTLSLIDPAAIAFTPLRNPPILSAPIGRFKRFQTTAGGLSQSLPPTPLPSTLMVRSSPVSSLPASPSSLCLGSPPILHTQHKPDGILSQGSSFTFKPDLPSSHLSPTTGLKSTIDTKMELPSSQLSPAATLKSTIDTKISPGRAETKSKRGLLDALTSPGRVKANIKSRLLDALLEEAQAKGKGGLLDDLLQDALLREAQANTGSKSGRRKIPLGKSLRREGLLSESLKAEDLLAESSSGEALLRKTKDLLSAKWGREGSFSESSKTIDLLGENSRREGLSSKSSKTVDLLGESSGIEGSSTESSKTQDLLGKRSSGEVLLAESSKRKGLLGKSLREGGLLRKKAKREDLLASQEQNAVLDGCGPVCSQSTISSQLEFEFGSLWDELSSVHSSAGEKANSESKEDQMDIIMPEDLSSLLEFFPTTDDEVPEWYWNGEEITNVPSPGEVDVSLGLEMQNTSRNNLPGIC